jgi:hypothetical protein
VTGMHGSTSLTFLQRFLCGIIVVIHVFSFRKFNYFVLDFMFVWTFGETSTLLPTTTTGIILSLKYVWRSMHKSSTL